MNFAAVALGGTLGAVCCYLISLISIKADFLLMTFLTNLLGAFCIGLITGVAVKKNAPANLILFLKTGL